MKKRTLVFIVNKKERTVLLGVKKVRFGKGKRNGLGGGPEGDESLEDAAIRETKEESGIDLKIEDLHFVAEIFFFFPKDGEHEGWDHHVFVYIAEEWKGGAQDTDEMFDFQWFPIGNLPLDEMWVSDRIWLPLVLEGQKLTGKVTFGPKGQTILEQNFKRMAT